VNRGEALKALGAVLAASRLPTDPTGHSAAAEGGGLFNVQSFGARGDASNDDRAAIQAAIDAAETAGGGVVWFPRGRYRIQGTIVVPPTLDKTIILRGEGMRDTYVYPATNGTVAIRFGADSPDLSGNRAHLTQYCGMEDLSVSGSLLTAGTSIGVQFVEMQKGWLRNVVIESFSKGSSIGLHLRGSLTSGGVGAPAAPHTWRCSFTNVIVATTMRPLVLDNCDESEFYSCNFSAAVAINAPTESIAAIEMAQGHNNRFYGLLVQGDRNVAYRKAYVGIKLATPVNGDNLGHQFYGLVAEGFNCGIYIESSTVRDILVLGFNSSISEHAFWNGSEDGSVNNQRQNNVTIEMVSDILYHRTNRSLWPESVTFNDGDSTPSVRGSDTFACHNSKPTTIANFVDGRPGQLIFVRLDTNTTVAANSNIRPVGNQNLAGSSHLMVGFALIGGVWEQISLSRNA
jgi:hypothetical protein